MHKIDFYTDGGCCGNPGPGGFGVLVILDEEKAIYTSEYCAETTNNREELKGIIKALHMAEKFHYLNPSIFIHSDSAYCINACQDWIWKWSQNDWKNSKKEIIKNKDLFLELYNLLTSDLATNISFVKIKGHNNNYFNEFVDALATHNNKKQEKYQKIITDNGITILP